MENIQVWSEGYAATGESSGAIHLGTFLANDFDEAVTKWLETLDPKDVETYYRYTPDDPRGIKHRFWACKLFDNEADARKSFG